MTGTAITFYRPDSWYSHAVGWWQCSEWVHVGIRHRIAGVDCITEASPRRGVIVTRADRAQRPDAEVPLPFITDNDAMAWISPLWATPYGWLDVFGTVTHTRSNSRGMTCSELVAVILAKAEDAHLFPADLILVRMLLAKTRTDRVTPADLADAFGIGTG